MYPDEYVSGKMVLDTLHAHQREDAALLIFGLDANVILQTFDVENVVQPDLD